jgi:N-acyl-D-amino-acid deacylase
VGLIASIEEVIRIAGEAELPGIVSHIKALGTGVWGFSADVVHLIDQARDEGIEVYADQYPYSASSTNLTAVLIPAWAREGGRISMLERLQDPGLMPDIRTGMEDNLARRGGPESIRIAEFPPNPDFQGLRLSEIAIHLEQDPIDAALTLIKSYSPRIISFNMNDEDVARFMRQTWTMTSSDGGLVEMGSGVIHPRNYGSFPRKISKYVQEEQIIDLPFAIRSMTSLPASVFGMNDRGILRPGQVADITIFNLDTLRDRATYSDPHQLSEGVEYVMVNGKMAVQNGRFRSALHGRVLVNSSK